MFGFKSKMALKDVIIEGAHAEINCLSAEREKLKKDIHNVECEKILLRNKSNDIALELIAANFELSTGLKERIKLKSKVEWYEQWESQHMQMSDLSDETIEKQRVLIDTLEKQLAAERKMW